MTVVLVCGCGIKLICDSACALTSGATWRKQVFRKLVLSDTQLLLAYVRSLDGGSLLGIERRAHALRVPEIAPAEAGDFQHGEPLRYQREHVLRKIGFWQTPVELAHPLGLRRRPKQRAEASEGTIQRLGGARDDVAQRSHRGDHDETVPEAAMSVQHRG